jgi:hypothetical protein
MSDTSAEDMRKAEGIPARRIEVFTGAGRRRRWSAEEKAAIVAELRGDGSGERGGAAVRSDDLAAICLTAGGTGKQGAENVRADICAGGGGSASGCSV